MPNTVRPDNVISMFTELQARIKRLENSVQTGNQSVIAGSFQVLDPTGKLVLSLGYQPDGTVGLGMYNPADGTKLAQLGQVNASPLQYGLTVRQGAAMQLIAGAVAAYSQPVRNLTAPSGLIQFSDGPVVNATVGPSGMALVGIGGWMGTSGSAGPSDADALLSIDGAVPRDGGGNAVLLVVGTGESAFSQALVTGLTPGTHIFAALFQVSGANGTVGSFQNRVIVVLPL